MKRFKIMLIAFVLMSSAVLLSNSTHALSQSTPVMTMFATPSPHLPTNTPAPTQGYSFTNSVWDISFWLTVLKNDISWIKDSLSIVFSIMTLMIALFTYRRAKMTLFQPLRTDVIRRQADVLERLYDMIHDEVEFLRNIDYFHIASCNIYLVLRPYGFQFDDNIYKEIADMVVASLYCKKYDGLQELYLPGLTLDEEPIKGEEYIPPAKEGKDRLWELAKEGVAEVKCLELSALHFETVRKLKDIANNPWLPTVFQKLVDQLITDIDDNLQNAMRIALEDAIVALCKEHLENRKILGIQPPAIYNRFLTTCKRHEPLLKDIQSSIRKHLRVDQKW